MTGLQALLALAQASPSSPWTDPAVLVPVGIVASGLAATIKVLWSRLTKMTDDNTKALAALHAEHAKQLDETRASYLAQIKSLTDAGRSDGNALNDKYHTAIVALREVIESLRRAIVDRAGHTDRGPASERRGGAP